MPPSRPLQIIALRPIASGSVVWRLGAVQRVSIFIKATFGLVHEQPARLVAPLELVDDDRRIAGLSSLEAASETAPYLPSAGVLLTGHAYAPGGTPTPAMSVRLAVYQERALVDKTLHVFGDRAAATSSTPQPFTRMPLTWERAFGGTGVEDNPVGQGAVFGIRAQPNLVDPSDPRKPSCFGPIPRQWVARRRLLGNADPRRLDLPQPEIPDDFDWRYFHSAPLDQQVDFLRGDEWIVLDGLHPTLPRLQSRLPQVQAKAIWRSRTEIGEIDEQPLDLVADLLIIDAERQICSVVWRGNFFLDSAESLAHSQVFAGVEMPGYPLVWPEIEGRAVPPPVPLDEHAEVEDAEPELIEDPPAEAEAPLVVAPPPVAAPPPVELAPPSVAPVTAPSPPASVRPAGMPSFASDDDEHTRVAGFVLPTAKSVLPFQSAEGARIGDEGSTVDQPQGPRAGGGRLDASALAPATKETDRLIASKVGRPVLPFTARAASPEVPIAQVPAASPIAPARPSIPSSKSPLGQTGDARVSPFSSGLPFKPATTPPTALTPAPAPVGPSPPRLASSIPSMVPDDDEDQGDPNLQTSAIRIEDHARLARLPVTPFNRPAMVGAAPSPDPAPIAAAPIAPAPIAAAPIAPAPIAVAPPAAPEAEERAPDSGTREYQIPISTTADSLPFGNARPRDLPFAASASPPARDLPFAASAAPAAPAGLPFAAPSPSSSPPLASPPPMGPRFVPPPDDGAEHPVPAELARRIDAALGGPPPLYRGASPAPPPPIAAPALVAPAPIPAPALVAPPPIATAPTPPFAAPPPIVGAPTIDPPAPRSEPPAPPSFVAAPPAAPPVTDASPADLADESTAIEEPDGVRAALELAQADGVRAQVRDKLAAGEPLTGLDLAGADLHGLDFNGAHLSGLNFKAANLRQAIFESARLADAQLAGADLTRADLRGADLTRADLSRATLAEARLDRAILADANLASAKGPGASFESATGARASFARGTWEGAIFRGFEAVNADFTGAALTSATFEAASLIELRLDDARATAAVFDGARLPQASARGASLTRCSFKDVDAPQSIWEKATLDESGFQGANLKGASLLRASCLKTSFAGADAAGANLQSLSGDGADLTGVNLEGADLRQARMREARFDEANLRRVTANKAELGKSRFLRADLAQAALRSAKMKGANLTHAKLDGTDLRDADLEQANLSGASRHTAKMNGANVKDLIDDAPDEG